MSSSLRAAIDFLEKFGFFDVILPFLLVFSIIFGILEKTRIFGSDEIDGKKVPKKNINSMVAFSIAFFVVATKKIVDVIETSLPQVALILIIIVCFLMLAGSFMADKDFSFEKRKYWVMFLTGVIFIAVVLIFVNAFGWLQPIIDWVMLSPPVLVVPLVLVTVVVGAVFFIVGGGGKSSEGGGD